MCAAACAAPAEVPRTLGAAHRPAAFCSVAIGILFSIEEAISKYPIPPGVCLTWPETPSLPFAPTPVGQSTAAAAPTLLFHSGLIAERYDVKINEVPLPSERCTTAIGRLGIFMPGFRRMTAGSDHEVIWPK